MDWVTWGSTSHKIMFILAWWHQNWFLSNFFPLISYSDPHKYAPQIDSDLEALGCLKCCWWAMKRPVFCTIHTESWIWFFMGLVELGKVFLLLLNFLIISLSRSFKTGDKSWSEILNIQVFSLQTTTYILCSLWISDWSGRGARKCFFSGVSVTHSVCSWRAHAEVNGI